MRIQNNPVQNYVPPSNKQLVVNAGGGSDQVKVTPKSMGGVDVAVRDKKGTQQFSFDAEEAKRLVIKTAGGNDSVVVDPRVKQEIKIEGNGGKDTLSGGSGNDLIYGGGGNDVVYGGSGNDVVYGGAGND